ncbi:MAG TPA: HD domain-containing protein, partial [Bacteroidota bacterium]|nr:HD domain-containing protein [Bacteroidota bacterium]
DNRKNSSHLTDIRHYSVIHLAENFHYEQEHSLHVAELALKIFNLTKKLHGLGDEERQYLEAAAILHEIGLYISHAQHHRHAYYLIRNSEMFGFTENEKEIIANVARYHRKSYPKLKHENFASLDPDEREVVQKLSAILRIADGLDRTHASVVKEVGVKKSRKSLTFLARHNKRTAADLELWGAERKKELFEKTFGVKVQIKTKAGK